MSTRTSIASYFENILGSIKNMEQGAQILSEMSTLATEIAQLEKYVKSSFETLDNQFQSHIQKINLLSSLIEFQRKIVRFKTPEDMTEAVFSYIKANVDFDHAFIYLRVGTDEENVQLIAHDSEQLDTYRSFLQENNNLKKLIQMVHEKDLGVLLSNIHQFQADQVPWNLLEAKSAIVFPLRMQGNFLGFGVLVRKEEPLLLNHLSFVNLILGLLSLLLFQHFYFFYLKRKLFNQVKLQKVLEEYKYAEYFEKGPIRIYSLDEQGIVLHANRAGLAAFQSRTSTIIGDKFLQLLPPEHRQEFDNHLSQVQVGNLQYYKSPVIIDKNETRLWEFYITKLEFHDRFDLNSIFAVDITEQHIREQRETRHQILQQVELFSDRINGVLNNLLTVMVPNVSLLQSHLPEDHNLQKYLTTMEKSLAQTTELVQKFLNYGLQEIEQPSVINLNKLIVDTVNNYRENNESRIEFSFGLDPAIPTLNSFPQRIKQLIGILLQNSLEALNNSGKIAVNTRVINLKQDAVLSPELVYLPAGKYVELQFEDSGPGISEEGLKQLFMPFYTTKIKNESAGLGLFVGYKIINDLSGEIHVHSVPGEFTRFHIFLPAVSGAETAEIIRESIEVKPALPPQILVVDDEFHIRSTLMEIFELKGYRVLSAENGEEGLRIYKQHPGEIDLIILDMMMPVMDGKTAFREIRKINPEQKIIIISGYTNRDDLQKILNEGALAFMSKPFQIEDILKRVAAVVEEKKLEVKSRPTNGTRAPLKSNND